MFFFARHSPQFCIIPTIAVGEVEAHCASGCCPPVHGWRIFLSFAGFDAGFGFLNAPKHPRP